MLVLLHVSASFLQLQWGENVGIQTVTCLTARNMDSFKLTFMLFIHMHTAVRYFSSYKTRTVTITAHTHTHTYKVPLHVQSWSISYVHKPLPYRIQSKHISCFKEMFPSKFVLYVDHKALHPGLSHSDTVNTIIPSTHKPCVEFKCHVTPMNHPGIKGRVFFSLQKCKSQRSQSGYGSSWTQMGS